MLATVLIALAVLGLVVLVRLVWLLRLAVQLKKLSKMK